jgi:hypothetical protein
MDNDDDSFGDCNPNIQLDLEDVTLNSEDVTLSSLGHSATKNGKLTNQSVAKKATNLVRLAQSNQLNGSADQPTLEWA